MQSDSIVSILASRIATIAEYANGFWDAFPDLSFEIVCQGADPCTTVGQWLMRGTTTGSFGGQS
ncbi:MAG: ester cyclase [Verrucomicrobia bacterium]|nr:ester cyclase [Verrucomicrobiota bacterium]